MKRNIGNEILEGIKEIKLKKIASKCKSLIECDKAEIRMAGGKMFLLIGFNRNTKDDDGAWIDQDGNRRDWDYINWHTVASGITKKEVIESAEEYARICGMTMEEYLLEQVQ